MEKMKALKMWQQLLLVFAILGFLVFITMFAMKPDTREVLYSNLDPNEAREIEQEISKMGVESKLESEGTVITMENTEIPRVKAHLASIGLPSSGDPGFELLSETSIGATKFDKEKRYEQALVGDIQKGLVQGFDFVEKAIVQLNYETSEHIFEDKSESKAAVTIHTKGDKNLTENQVRSIKNFIASSVKNLTADNVNVSDKNGIVYDFDDADAGVSVSGYNKQIEIVNKTEKRIYDDIMRMLAKNFGAENVALVVRADIDFDEIVRNIEKYDPKGTLVSRQEKKDTIRKRDGSESKEVGTASNGTVPDYEMENKNGDNAALSQDTSEIIENFEVGKTVETIKENPELTTVRVTATINESVDQTSYPNFVNEWEEIIANAAGIQFNPDGTFEKGFVKVSPQLYKVKDAEENKNDNSDALKKEEKEKLFMIIIISTVFVILTIVIVAWIIYKNHEKKEKEREEREKEELMKARNEMKNNGEHGDDDGVGSEIDDTEQTRTLMNEIDKNKKLKSIDLDELTNEQQEIAGKVKEIAEENPTRTAEYIKKLINEG